jgi:hypothetical protein
VRECNVAIDRRSRLLKLRPARSSRGWRLLTSDASKASIRNRLDLRQQKISVRRKVSRLNLGWRTQPQALRLLYARPFDPHRNLTPVRGTFRSVANRRPPGLWPAPHALVSANALHIAAKLSTDVSGLSGPDRAIDAARGGGRRARGAEYPLTLRARFGGARLSRNGRGVPPGRP